MHRASIITRTAVRGIRFSSTTQYQHILTEVKGNVGIITLNRPKQLNALCNALLDEVIDAGKKFDKDDQVGCIIITGSEKAFAAGADIKEMSTMTFAECYTNNLFHNWTEVPKISKPVSSRYARTCYGSSSNQFRYV
jgi:enoyl-CoA hydratase/carnithine racemase